MPSLATKSGSEHPAEARSTITITCIDCDAIVFEWSTPHPDRCWECAETADLEAPL